MPKSDSILDTEGWKTIDWRQAERYVFKLQKRIYAASRCGDIQRVRKLQKTLMRSWSNRVLAVRRVTQDNQGKKTAGVDGIKSLSPAARFELAKGLFVNGKSKPTRRIWIPKPGNTETTKIVLVLVLVSSPSLGYPPRYVQIGTRCKVL